MLVDDIKRLRPKAKSLGANVVKEAIEVTGEGIFSIIIDPTGAVLGLLCRFQLTERVQRRRLSDHDSRAAALKSP